MGQAKARGTFEERKAEAIAAGRVKTPATKRNVSVQENDAAHAVAMVVAGWMGTWGSKLKRKVGR